MTAIKGLVGYLVTPFAKDGSGIDSNILKKMVDQLINDGVNAIAPLGSTGECAYLNYDEWCEVAQVSIKHTAKRVPTVVGISDLTTADTVRRAKFAQDAGADCLMMIPISYWKLSENEIFNHFATVAKAVSIPIMAYNNPATSGIDMSPEFIVRMVKEIDNVTMVKESTGDIQRMHKIWELGKGEIPFYNGANPLALEAFAAGATGWCTAAPNLIPKLTSALYQAVLGNNLKDSRDIFYRQLPLLRFILQHGGLPATIKAGLKLKGIDAGLPRAPLAELAAEPTKQLAEMLSKLS